MNDYLKTAGDLGTLVRNKRRQAGLTQAELAAQAGVGLRFLIELEQGKPTAQLGKALVVARAAGIRLVDAESLAEPFLLDDNRLSDLPRY